MKIEFDKFQISLLETKDSDSFYNLIDSNRDRFEDYFAGTVSKTKTLKDTQAYCEVIKQKIEDKSYFPFVVSLKEDNSFVGLVDIKNVDWNVPKAEVGYLIDKAYEGKGITSKALALVMDYVSDEFGFKKILCRANSENLSSIGVALKNKFELEGTIRRDYKTTKNEVVDLNYYGRLF